MTQRPQPQQQRPQLQSTYPTLWALSEAVEDYYKCTVPTIYGGIGYGENCRINIAPDSAKENYLHIIITRLDSGWYELVSYRL